MGRPIFYIDGDTGLPVITGPIGITRTRRNGSSSRRNENNNRDLTVRRPEAQINRRATPSILRNSSVAQRIADRFEYLRGTLARDTMVSGRANTSRNADRLTPLRNNESSSQVIRRNRETRVPPTITTPRGNNQNTRIPPTVSAPTPIPPTVSAPMSIFDVVAALVGDSSSSDEEELPTLQ